MKNYIFLAILGLLLYSNFVLANGAIVIVANTPDQSIELSRHEVRKLFMGGALPYNLNPITLPPGNHTRVLFNTKVVGLTESRIQSYWAQMRFTGRKNEPKEIGTERAILEYIKSHSGAVGYLPAGTFIPDELTVLYSTP